METGTGKTYCYIKTIFELHKTYGWSRFVIMVPSIAIREGVRKSSRLQLIISMKPITSGYGSLSIILRVLMKLKASLLTPELMSW